MKTHVKAGDEVVVLAGNPRGQRGKILQLLPKQQRVLVEGVNKRKFHEKKKKEGDAGGIIEREAPIHVSNVMRADIWEERQARKKTAAAPKTAPAAETTGGK